MRIIGGKHRGKQILPPKNFDARPTTDFAKEGLFNTLTNNYNFQEISVLDLFSGTGGITYEFASRGAPSIISIEMNPFNSSFIKETVTKLNLRGVKVVRHNVFHFLEICKIKFDIIFADPPYNLVGLETLPDKVLSRELLKENGEFILEHPSSFTFTNHPSFFKEKKYGNVHFTFFML